MEDVEDIIERQISDNSAIAEEGLVNSWGANVGRVILKSGDATDVRVRAKAKAAAGSDACLPTVVQSVPDAPRERELPI